MASLEDRAGEPGEDASALIAEMEGWLGRGLRRAANSVGQRFADHFAEFRIRPALYTVMIVIERYPGIAGGRIGQIMDVPHANIVVVLKELETRGLVVRETDLADRRAQRIRLSAEGEALIVQLHEAHEKHLADLEKRLNRKDQLLLLALLKRLGAEGV